MEDLLTHRCPAWCDRILMNQQGMKLVQEVRPLIQIKQSSMNVSVHCCQVGMVPC